jgi:acetylornithine deacetylase
VDPREQLSLTRELVDIDSTTGVEQAAGAWIAATLRRLGWTVVEQPVADGRANVLATAGRPEVVFSTHYDCVPPFFPSRVEGGRLHGRGAADAKGALVAQIAAAERLRAAGEDRVGLLFVVGEEEGSDGARAANAIPPGSRFLVDGEPTGNRLGAATRGVYRVRLAARGRAAHSSLPHLGASAIDALLDALLALRAVAWPEDPLLGRTHYTVGTIAGGVAPNVIPPAAEAQLLFRTVGDPELLRRLLAASVGPRVTIEEQLVVPPVRLRTLPGIPAEVFAFTTDIPFLDRWGEPLLLGPGSITQAHTADEHVAIADLERATDLYVAMARTLLAGSPGVA